MESLKKELIGYLRANDIVLLAMAILFGLVGIVTLAFVGIPGVMFIIPAIIAYVNWYGKRSEATKLIKALEKDAGLDSLLADYRDGERFLNGRLIRGDRYIMARGSGTVIALDDIVKISDCRKKNGWAGDTRILRAETADGGKYDLAFLSLKGKNDDDIRRLTGGNMHHLRGE